MIQDLETRDLHTAQFLFEKQKNLSKKDATEILTEHRRQVLELRQIQKQERDRLKERLHEKLAKRKQTKNGEVEDQVLYAEVEQEEGRPKKVIIPLEENGNAVELQSLSSEDDELVQKYGELMDTYDNSVG